jgi:imidazolonepropionase-like amidohydrolase
VVQDGHIAGVGPDLPVPDGAEVVDGRGRTVVAGLWNCHLHFTEPKWRNAARAPATALTAQLRDIATGRGFTTVVDAGSDPRSTLPLRRRVVSGEVEGPRIYTAGPSVFPPNGIPYYIRDSLPFLIRLLVPKPRSERAARRFTERNIRSGADLLKLFTGSYVARGRILPMPEEIARAAAEVAHAHRQLVFCHPSNLEGTRIALRAGVDVLAHPPDTTDGVDEALLREMVARGMSMIPTLKMFADTANRDPRYLEPIYEVVRRFHALGGQLLFGTDVGYMHDYAIDDEITALVRAGIPTREILRMLTTSPAERFGVGSQLGSVVVGQRADLAILTGDPLGDPLALARVHATIIGGRVRFP